jgi:hypothetical protein
MPRVWAQATPAMTAFSLFSVLNACGVSIREEILIGASVAQSRSVQYDVFLSYVVSVSLRSHLVAPTKP